MTDLFKIGTSSLLGNQNQLASTSNNIANVNTPGYTRQRTEYTSYVEWGVGRPQVVRMFDKYATDQLRRDTTEQAKLQTYSDNSSILDNLFSDETTSIAKGLDSVFQRLHEASDEPTSLTPRQLFISDANALVARMQGLSDRVLEQEEIVNDELKLEVSETNSLISSLYDLNGKIVTSKKSNDVTGEASPELLDEREEVVRQLASKLNLQVMEDDAGAYLVNTQGGQTLVTNANYFQLAAVPGNPDPQRTDIEFYINSNPSITKDFRTEGLGGSLGGLTAYRTEVLDQTINSLGQLAISFSDAINEQNKLGVTLDGELGGDVFNIPTIKALGYDDNSSADHLIEVGVEDGFGDQVANFDYELTFTSATEYTLQAYQGGETIGAMSGPFTIPAVATDSQASADGLPDGLEFTFTPDGSFAEGDTFLVRPSRLAGVQIEMNLNRPEQLALASPITVENPITNIGSGKIEIESITSTNTDNTNADETAFTSNGFDAAAPASIQINASGGYDVYDTAGTLIGTASTGDNIMQQLKAAGDFDAGGRAATGDDYPGFEVNISGDPKPGDVFNIGFNSEALDDNYNGLALTDLQSEDTMRRNIAGSGNNTLTFGEAYSNLIGYIGDTANRAEIDLASSNALLEQSFARVQDMAGVNLDEEAADLIKFEQAYNASARILTVAQTIFDSLLSAVR